MTYFLGIDSSTTGVKALVIDSAGNVVGTATTEIPYSTPKPLWSEQDPAVWWSGTVNSIQVVLNETGLTGHDIAAVGLSGQMHGLSLLDEPGKGRVVDLWRRAGTIDACAYPWVRPTPDSSSRPSAPTT